VINLHAHTTFSDGVFPPELIVNRAAEDGLTHIAITDHFETSKVASLSAKGIEKYLSTIRNLRRKYEGTIEVLAGVEIDANPTRCDLRNLPFDLLNELDLVLFELTNGVASGREDLEDLDYVLSNISVLRGLAHCDIKTCFADMRAGQIADMLSSNDLFVELNTALPYRRDGLTYYEQAENLIRECGGRIKLSIGTDVHRRLNEVSNVHEVYHFVKRLDLIDNLLF
jgi:histidinol phosphatase-like PHP family hydrolase